MSHTPTLRGIFDEHGAFVWRALRYLGVPERDLEDQVQEVFLVVHRRFGTFKGQSNLSTWIYGICLRVASDFRRRAHVRREDLAARIPEGEVAAEQEHAAELERFRGRLLRALEGLDDKKREVYVLFEIEELNMKEIIELVGCPLQTGYSRLQAARDHVQHVMTSGGSDE